MKQDKLFTCGKMGRDLWKDLMGRWSWILTMSCVVSISNDLCSPAARTTVPEVSFNLVSYFMMIAN